MKKSAGILLYRCIVDIVEVMLVHPGGPFWVKKDDGAWSIPKGEFENEEPLVAAIREFYEETGFRLPVSGSYIQLTPLKQKSGKLVYAWALEHNLDPDKICSNLFEIEWPPHSGKMKEFPEVDRAAWFTPAEAEVKITAGQKQIIHELLGKIRS